jgi:hypothetical protein
MPTDVAPAETGLERIWRKARQGAANVAGVDYQVALSGWLLVHARSGPVLADSVRPEGFEDIDCLGPEGQVLVQAKDRVDGRWTRGNMAAAIAHAQPVLQAASESRFVLVSSVPIGQGLIETGIAGSLSALDAEATAELLAAIKAIRPEADEDLLARCALHSVSRQELTDQAIATLSKDFDVPPALAAIAFSVLLDDLQQATATQRSAGLNEATVRTPSDLDGLIYAVKTSIDFDALDAAEKAGLLRPVDFATPIEMDAEKFLLGVDVRPGHVAAGLDVLRSDELDQVFNSLRSATGLVISGPSGAGKSALLWRSAYELRSSMRLVELRRVAVNEVDEVLRWLSENRPTPRSQIILCVDDLGRPELEGWPTLAAGLADLPGVLVLASCREEDLRPDFLRGELSLLRPSLDEKLAGEIAEQLVNRQVTLRHEPGEAFAESGGLLLEYVALLTTGERLERVVGEQVHDRLGPERTVERDILRLVCGAHLGGVGVPFSALGELIDDGDDMPSALERLRDEFLIRATEDSAWVGLHELRSRAAHEALHRSPPPEEHETLNELLAVLQPAVAAHLFRRVVDQGMAPDRLVDGLVAALGKAGAGGVGELLNAVIEIEALEHVRLCWQTTLAFRGPTGADGLLTVAFMYRFAGVASAGLNAQINQLAALLPEPPLDLGPDLGEALDRPSVVKRALEGETAAVASMLETAAVLQTTALTPEDAVEIFDAHGAADAHDYGRLVTALRSLVPDATDSSEVLKPLAERIQRLADGDSRILSVSTEEGPPFKLTIEVFSTTGRLPTALRQEVGRLALDLCPEVQQLRLEPRPPRGLLAHIPVEPAMDAPRSALPSPGIEIRRNIAFREALERVRAAESWTERVRRQAELVPMLAEVVRDAKTRILNGHDNDSRRREWARAVARCGELAGELPKPPLPRKPGEDATPDPAGEAIDTVVLRLNAVVGYVFGEDVAIAAVAVGLYESAHELKALGGGVGADLARPVAEALTQPLLSLARVLFVKHEHPDLSMRDKGDRATWDEATDALAVAAEEELTRRDVGLVETALRGLDPEITVIEGGPALSDVPGPVLVVVVPEEHRDIAVWDRLNELDEEDRMKVAFRVSVLPQRQGVVMPSEGWTIGSKRVFPVDRDIGERICKTAGLPHLDSATLDISWQLLDAVVDASEAAAWAAARRDSGFEAAPLIDAAQAAVEQCHVLLSKADMPEIAQKSVRGLIDTVEKELAGEDTVSQIVGHVRLKQFGDENDHSVLLSATRGILVSLAVDELVARSDLVATSEASPSLGDCFGE